MHEYLSDPWAISEPHLWALLHLAEANAGIPLANLPPLASPLAYRDNTAIIDIKGPLFRRANPLQQFLGVQDIEQLGAVISGAISDLATDRIILNIDSPGGQASGIGELAALIRSGSAHKPIVAYVDGLAASAAYWLASAAGELIIAPTALLGSIGVMATYQAAKDAPVKLISAQSPLKGATPDTPDGALAMQGIIDQLAALFIEDVAAHRGVSSEHVMTHFGRGGLVIGNNAVAAGMADRVARFASLFKLSPELTRSQQLMSENPATYQAEAAAPPAPDLDAAVTQAALAERQRMAAIVHYAKDNGLNETLAFACVEQGISVEAAQALLDASGPVAKLDSAPQVAESDFAAYMARLGNPDVGADADSEATAADPVASYFQL